MNAALDRLERWDSADVNFIEIPTESGIHAEYTAREGYKDYRKTWVEASLRPTIVPFPIHVDLEATAICNLDCPMCFREQMDKASLNSPKMFMSEELFEKLIQECGTNGARSIKFNYRGEPTIHPKLAHYVRRAKEESILDVWFNSNGTLMKEKPSRGLLEAGLDRVKFSVDSVDPETYKKIRIGTNFQLVSENIKNFVRLRNEMRLRRPVVSVQMVYMKANQHELSDYLKYWWPIVDSIGFSRYRSITNREHMANDPNRVEKTPDVKIPCEQIFQRLMVLCSGEVRMCCADYQGENVLGDANKVTLKSIWEGYQLASYRDAHKRGCFGEVAACAHCDMNTITESRYQAYVAKLQSMGLQEFVPMKRTRAAA